MSLYATEEIENNLDESPSQYSFDSKQPSKIKLVLSNIAPTKRKDSLIVVESNTTYLLSSIFLY